MAYVSALMRAQSLEGLHPQLQKRPWQTHATLKCSGHTSSWLVGTHMSNGCCLQPSRFTPSAARHPKRNAASAARRSLRIGLPRFGQRSDMPELAAFAALTLPGTVVGDGFPIGREQRVVRGFVALLRASFGLG